MNYRNIYYFFVSVALSLLCSCLGWDNTIITKMGDHNIEIENASLRTYPFIEENFNGKHSSVFIYDGEKYKVRIENDILTVNQNRYLIPDKTDSIKICNNRVEINGRIAVPEKK